MKNMFEFHDHLQVKFQAVKMDNKINSYWIRSERLQWLTALFIGTSSMYMCRTVMPLCAVAISTEMKWSKTDTGTVLSAFFWGYTLTQVLGGTLSDKLGGDIVLATTAVGWSLVTFWTPAIMYFFSGSHMGFKLLVLSRVVIGCFQGAHFPAITSLISRKVADEDKAFSYSIATSGAHLGTLLIGWIGSVLLDFYGWQVPFYVTGFVGMAWLLIFRYHLIRRERAKVKLIDMRNNIALNSPPVISSNQIPWKVFFKSLPFWALIVGHFCHCWAYHLLLSWLPTYFKESFVDAKGWIFNVVPWLVTLPSVMLGGYLADLLLRKGFSVTAARKIIQSVSFVGTISFLLILSYVTAFPAALFCMSAALACSGFHNSGILLNPTDIAPKFSGSVFGIMNTAGAIPGFLGVYVAGYTLDLTHSWALVFHQTAFICFIGWLVYMIFGSGSKIV